MRRGRIDSDAWEPVDIPLGEDREAYEIDILREGVVIRTIAASTSSIFYASADEIADFGGPQATLDLCVTQVSATVGRGFPARHTVPIL